MSDLKFIIDSNEDEYPPFSHDPQKGDNIYPHHGAPSLVYRGGESKPGGSSGFIKPLSSGASGDQYHDHHRSIISQSGNKGKGNESADADVKETDEYKVYKQTSAQYTMAPNNAYAASGGHYYHHPHLAHQVPPTFESRQTPALSQQTGLAASSTYDAGPVRYYAGAIPDMQGHSSMTAQPSMSGHHDVDAAGYAMYSDSTELTPVTHRPSRAKKGKRVHYCDVCNKTYTRAEHLRRHQLAHSPPLHYCRYPDCGRAFHRSDLLIRHLNKQHIEGGQSHDADEDESTYSDGQGLLPPEDYPEEAWANTAEYQRQ